MIVEVCANSYKSASKALEAGADRIELCSELALGGVTPSHGLIQKVREELRIDVNVLIRPRSGDFTFSDDEFDVMKRNIQFCKDVGCNGIVSGVLTSDYKIDIERTTELVAFTKPLTFTFHRAFDWVDNPLQAMNNLIDIGVNRILTSGQASSAIMGLELLTQLQKIAAENLIVLPGGGVNEHNIVKFKETGFKEIHFSATELHKTIEIPKLSMNSSRFFDETYIATSSKGRIERLIELVK